MTRPEELALRLRTLTGELVFLARHGCRMEAEALLVVGEYLGELAEEAEALAAGVEEAMRPAPAIGGNVVAFPPAGRPRRGGGGTGV